MRVFWLVGVVLLAGCRRGEASADAGGLPPAAQVTLAFGDAPTAVGSTWTRRFSLQATLPVQGAGGLKPLVQRQERTADVTLLALDGGMSRVGLRYAAQGGTGPGWDAVAGRAFEVRREGGQTTVLPEDPARPPLVHGVVVGDTLDALADPAFRAALPVGAVALGARVPSLERYLRPLVEGAFGGRTGDVTVKLARAGADVAEFSLAVPVEVALEGQRLATTLEGTLRVRVADGRITLLRLEGLLRVQGPQGPVPFPGAFSLELALGEPRR